MENCSELAVTDSSSFNYKATFDRKLSEYDEQHQGAHRKPWTSERIFEVINDIKKARVTMSSGQRRKAMDYYWMSKYDIVTDGNEDCLIFKRNANTAPTIRILPREQYFDVLSDIHESCSHGGRDKILHEIKNRYYIPKKAVEIFVSLCPTCGSKRNTPRKGIVVTKPTVSCTPEYTHNSHNYSRPRPISKQVQKNFREEPPPASTVCRVCLAQDFKLFTVSDDLQNVYQTITREEYNKVGYPVCMCYICLAELRKCHFFMETARDSNRVLEQWYNQQHEKAEAESQQKCTVTKVEPISIQHDEHSLEHIKEEKMVLDEVDVEPDCHEYDLGIDIKEEIVEQTDTLQDSHNRQEENCPLIDQAPGTSSDSYRLDGIKKDTTPISGKNDRDFIQIEIFTGTKKSTQHCSVCSFKCNTGVDLARHMQFHDTSRPHVCDICQYRFDDLIHLEKHKTMHKTIEKLKNSHKKHIKLFICDICEYKCKSKSNFKKHIFTHTGKKQHSCDICNDRFTSFYSLQTHVKSKHTNEKPFTCNICNCKFPRKEGLRFHMKRHTGEKPFTCRICDEKYVHRFSLKNHLRTKHKIEMSDETKTDTSAL